MYNQTCTAVIFVVATITSFSECFAEVLKNLAGEIDTDSKII